MTFFRPTLVLFISASTFSTACASAPEPPPSVVLVTFDTLRADRLSAHGPMPVLRAMARRATHLPNAHTPMPLTLPAHATMLTGRGPAGHLVRDNIGYVLDESIPTVTEVFAAAGYDTAAFVGGYPLDRTFGLSRGFDTYDDRMTRTPPGGRSGHTERRAEEVIGKALAWLDRPRTQPLFLWIHLFDPHDPYEAPPSFASRFANPYDAEVAYADWALGRLLEHLGSTSTPDPWLFVTADHGESLSEHGEPTHGVFLYESTLRIPLIVRPPGGREPRSVSAPVALTDLAPTLLDAAGLPHLDGMEGQSLLDAVENGEPPPARPLLVESIHGRRKYGWAPLSGFLDWPLKYIESPTPEVYDLEKDPAETRNLHSTARAPALRQRWLAIRGEFQPPRVDAPSTADLDRLASLGYVGGTAVAAEEMEILWDHARPDPKDRIAALPALEAGLTALAAGRLARAKSELSTAREIDPDNLVALNNLGIVALQEGDLERAVDFFREGLSRDAAAEQIANNLGIALARLGRLDESVAAYQQALRIRPGFTGARFNLAVALHRLGRNAQALRELERVESEQPDLPELAATLRQVSSAVEKNRSHWRPGIRTESS